MDREAGPAPERAISGAFLFVAGAEEQAKQFLRFAHRCGNDASQSGGGGGYYPDTTFKLLPQVSTDAAQGIIVAVGVSPSGSDYGQLEPAVEKIKETLGRVPAAESAACAFKAKCCRQNAGGRMVVREEEAPAVVAFRAKMETEEAQQIYRQRGPVAEFSNAWIKVKIGLRQFRLRGLLKVTLEATWACLTYNIQQWIRLRRRKQPALGTA